MKSSNSPMTLSRKLTDYVDPVEAYQKLCDCEKTPTALLETASISSKEHTRSIVVLSSALNIRCRGETIVFSALNSNGLVLLSSLEKVFKEKSYTVKTFANNCDLEGFVTGDAAKCKRFEVSISHQKMHATVDEQEKLLANNVLDALRVTLDYIRTQTLDDKTLFLVGTLSFDLYQLFESVPVLEQSQAFPDYDFFLADRLLIIDHENLSSRLVSKVFFNGAIESCYYQYQQLIAENEERLKRTLSPMPLNERICKNKDQTVEVNLDGSAYQSLVKIAKKHIELGEVFQIVLARDFTLPCVDALLSYRYLRTSNPSPYMFYLRCQDYTLFGASPESAVKYEKDTNRVMVYPIAGTRKRGVNQDGSLNEDLDSRIALELKADQKECAEHIMLVDLARNDVARVGMQGTRRIDRLMEIDRYSHVMHLVSKVSANLQLELDALHAYQACMNMGTLTGAPKIRASQLIRRFENKFRGVYGGAMGFINAYGDMDTAIVIRSALVVDKKATVSAGAGIVFDSDPELEQQETENKAAAVIQAIRQSNQCVNTFRDDFVSKNAEKRRVLEAR